MNVWWAHGACNAVIFCAYIDCSLKPFRFCSLRIGFCILFLCVCSRQTARVACYAMLTSNELCYKHFGIVMMASALAEAKANSKADAYHNYISFDSHPITTLAPFAAIFFRFQFCCKVMTSTTLALADVVCNGISMKFQNFSLTRDEGALSSSNWLLCRTEDGNHICSRNYVLIAVTKYR